MKVLQFDRYGGPEVLHVAEQAIPDLNATELLVRVHAATVGWGDCKLRAGLLQDFYPVVLPKVPGRYGSGTVFAVGSDVRNVQVGEAVVVAPLHSDSGSAAEYLRVACDKVAVKSCNLDHVQTASIIQGAVSAYACLVETAQVTAGQHILIHGAAGSIGSACTELARHLGAFVTGTCREVDRDYVQSLGAQRVVAFDRQQFARLVSNQNVVIDLVGGEVHRQSQAVLRKGGRLVYLNASQIDDQQPSNGIRSFNAVVSNRGPLLDAVCRLAEAGVFAPKVGKVLPLEEGAAAHRLLEQGAVKRGRIVLRID